MTDLEKIEMLVMSVCEELDRIKERLDRMERVEIAEQVYRLNDGPTLVS